MLIGRSIFFQSEGAGEDNKSDFPGCKSLLVLVCEFLKTKISDLEDTLTEKA